MKWVKAWMSLQGNRTLVPVSILSPRIYLHLYFPLMVMLDYHVTNCFSSFFALNMRAIPSMGFLSRNSLLAIVSLCPCGGRMFHCYLFHFLAQVAVLHLIQVGGCALLVQSMKTTLDAHLVAILPFYHFCGSCGVAMKSRDMCVLCPKRIVTNCT